MIGQMRRAARGERGQALVMACVLVLVVALATVSTVHLGHALGERIRLQNTADAAAYSMAAMEARAFNLYAYSNRAQASHYVSAMLFQSIGSFLFFGEAFLTDVYGVMLTLNPCAGNAAGFWKLACPLLDAVPILGPVLRVLDASILVFEKLVALYQRVLRASGVDEVIGRQIIPALWTLNAGLAATSTAVMVGTLAQVEGSTDSVIADNDPNLPMHPGRALTGGVSACMFDRAHFAEANGTPQAPNMTPDVPLRPSERKETSRVARAKRAMAQIANASRYACDGQRGCPERMVTGRTADLLPLPSWLSPLSSFLAHMPKWGQTRLLTFGLGKGFEAEDGGNYLREPVDTPDAPSSMLAQGDNLGSDDLYELKLGPPRLGLFRNPLSCGPDDPPEQCWGDPRRDKAAPGHDRPFRFMLKTSIWASNDDEPHVPPGGIHWRVAYPDGPMGEGHVAPNAPNAIEREMGLNRFLRSIAPGVQVAVYAANVRPIADGNHRWPGLAPFPHFEPGEFATPCGTSGARGADPSTSVATSRRDDFNQPSTWVALNKPAGALLNDVAADRGAGSVGPALLRGRVQSPLARGTLVLSDARSTQSGQLFGPGVNALARGQVYYHRPGNWAEQPNFFNPYWRPRLAAVLQARDTPLVEDLIAQLPPALAADPARVLTH